MSASWVNKLNESDSRLHKEDVIRQALEAATLGSTNAINFLKLIHKCYNPYVTFGVRQVPSILDSLSEENPWEDFMDLLKALEDRLLTGNAANDAIDEMSARFSAEEWNTFCAPVMRRDLRAGISNKTINKICKRTEYEIPIFGCQLATNSENRPELCGNMYLEPKLDGVRVLIEVSRKATATALGKPTVVTCYSRNGKVFENFTHIEEQIIRYASAMYVPSELKNGFVLDGEVVGNSFQELMRQARRKENVNSEDSVFHVFDILPKSAFHEGHYNAQLHKRADLLKTLKVHAFNNMPNVEVVPYTEVDLDTEDGKEFLENYAKEQVALGYEGIMIKNPDAPYECKRNTFWMKWKPTLTVDLQVVGVEEGTGRNKGRLGALICAGNDYDKEIKVNVGSGFSDSDRDSLWEDKQYVVGKTAEILCDSISQNQDGTHSLRFPRFIRFRDDK